MIAWIREQPWIWIVVTFVLLIAAWIVLIKIAKENQPEVIPVIQAGEKGGQDDGN